MLVQEEDLRKFLDRFFEKHYKMKIILHNMVETNPNHIINTSFRYRFEKSDDNYFATIFDVPYVEDNQLYWHNIYLIFTESGEIVPGNKYEASMSAYDLISALNVEYKKLLKKLNRRKEIKEKFGNNRLIKKFIKGKTEKDISQNDDKSIQQ